MKSRKHKKLEVLDNILKTVYYGVMGEDPGTSLILQGTQFIDIPKALLLCQASTSVLKISISNNISDILTHRRWYQA